MLDRFIEIMLVFLLGIAVINCNIKAWELQCLQKQLNTVVADNVKYLEQMPVIQRVHNNIYVPECEKEEYINQIWDKF